MKRRWRQDEGKRRSVMDENEEGERGEEIKRVRRFSRRRR